MPCSALSFNFMIKKYFLILFLLFSCRLLAQPTLSLDWMKTESISKGQFIKHDSQGNIIASGRKFANVGSKIKVIKYDSTGLIIWNKTLSDPFVAGGAVYTNAMVLDTFDNIYIAGVAHAETFNPQLGPEPFLLKYNSQGTLLWFNLYGHTVGLEGEVNSMEIYHNKYLLLAGKMDSLPGSSSKSFLAQYDSSGSLNWTYLDTNSYETFSPDIVVDKIGNSYLCGVTACCLPGYDMYVTKVDLAGNKKWSNLLSDTAYNFGYTYAGAIDDSANVYLTGTIQKNYNNTGHDCGVAKMDSAGNKKWFYGYTRSIITTEWETPKDIFIDKKFNVYSFGIVQDFTSANNADGFIISTNLQGVKNWDYILSGPSNLEDAITCGLVSKNGQAIFAGGENFNNNIYGPVILAFDSSGSIECFYNDSSFCGPNDIVEIYSSFYLTGSRKDPSGVLVDSLYSGRYNYSLSNGFTKIKNIEFKSLIFPNPFQDNFNVKMPKGTLPLKFIIRNSYGEILHSNCCTLQNINSASWQPGVYIAEFIWTDKIERVKLIKTN